MKTIQVELVLQKAHGKATVGVRVIGEDDVVTGDVLIHALRTGPAKLRVVGIAVYDKPLDRVCRSYTAKLELEGTSAESVEVGDQLNGE